MMTVNLVIYTRTTLRWKRLGIALGNLGKLEALGRCVVEIEGLVRVGRGRR